MPFNGMHGDTDAMRTAAKQMVASKPVVPAWSATEVVGTELPGVKAVNKAVHQTVLYSKGFAGTVSDGLDLFGQITLLCADEYDAQDTKGANDIARTAAATMPQTGLVDGLNQRDFYGNLPPNEWVDFEFEGDGKIDLTPKEGD